MANWKDNLIKIEPYVAGEQPAKKDFIKLNANENPYPPAPGVAEVIRNFNAGGLNKYPDANALPQDWDLKRKISSSATARTMFWRCHSGHFSIQASPLYILISPTHFIPCGAICWAFPARLSL